VTRAESRPSVRLTAAGVAARVAAIGAICGLGLLCVLFVMSRPWHNWFDLTVYRGATSSWLHGHSLYAYERPPSEYGFTYPPFAALLMLPLALVGLRTAEALHLGACFLIAVATTTWLVRPVALRAGWTAWSTVALAVPVATVAAPVWDTMSEGQVNLFLLTLVLADFAALRTGRPWAGVGIGIAAAAKLTPALFVLYLLLTGRRRPTLVAIGTAAAATALGFGVAPSASVDYWFTELWNTGRVGRLDSPSNQSILGALARLADPHRPDDVLWSVLALAVLTVALARAVRASRSGDELVGFTLTGLAACLVSPISWTHHLVWVIPAGVVLLDLAAGTPRAGETTAVPRVRLAAGAGLAALVAVFWTSPYMLADIACGGACGTVPGVLAQNSATLALLALVVLLPARALGEPWPREVRAPRASARRPAPPRPGGWSPR
jgi:alpha-1,2-mannosyltransferase